MMYYLWKCKESTKDKMLVYVTDYKEIDNAGKVNVGGRGGDCYIDAELAFSSKIKMECFAYAQKMMEQ